MAGKSKGQQQKSTVMSTKDSSANKTDKKQPKKESAKVLLNKKGKGNTSKAKVAEENNNDKSGVSNGNGKHAEVAGRKRPPPKETEVVDSAVHQDEAVQPEKHVRNKGTDENSGKTKNVLKTAEPVTSHPPSKKQKLTVAHEKGDIEVPLPKKEGFVLVVGEGDTGQLGLGPDVMDRGRPGRVDLPPFVIQICAGGMHSVCLTVSGEVFTFGCNDEGALGRKVDEEDECMSPGKVDLKEKIVMVSAGDSHTAALSGTGHVYIWGTFRDSNGPIGLLPDHGKMETPMEIMKEHHTIKIASGCDHLVCLTMDGHIYTLGAAEQGQLGRVPECFSGRGGRRGLGFLLTPALVSCKKRSVRFNNIWTGSYFTFAKDKDTGDIYAWGLNNYYQLGISDMQNKFMPEKCNSFACDKNWMSISGGQHHTLALDGAGKVYSMGRKEYGRLGLGEEGLEEKSSPTLVPKLQNLKCIDVNSGSTVSYAVTDEGTIFVWGMGSTKQLGQGDDEDDVFEPLALAGKQLENKKGLMVSAGGQHTIFLAQDRS